MGGGEASYVLMSIYHSRSPNVQLYLTSSVARETIKTRRSVVERTTTTAEYWHVPRQNIVKMQQLLSRLRGTKGIKFPTGSLSGPSWALIRAVVGNDSLDTNARQSYGSIFLQQYQSSRLVINGQYLPPPPTTLSTLLFRGITIAVNRNPWGPKSLQ